MSRNNNDVGNDAEEVFFSPLPDFLVCVPVKLNPIKKAFISPHFITGINAASHPRERQGLDETSSSKMLCS